MTKWCIGVFFLVLCWTSMIAQAPSLDVFTSDDGTFQFVYPQSYELLVGERILKATQGRHSGISVCDFSTALACVIYPIETPEDTNFEAAGFFCGCGSRHDLGSGLPGISGSVGESRERNSCWQLHRHQ